jgi:hypothetical protein
MKKKIHFESVSEIVEYAKTCPGEYDGRASVGDFYGATFDEAVRLSSDGWDEGARRAAEVRATLDGYVEQFAQAKAGQYGYDVAAGEWLDVGRYLGGEPECFGVRLDDGESLNSPVIRLAANVSASSAVSHKSLFSRGAVILAAIDVLESVGKRVELTVCFGSQGYGVDPLEVSVLAKAANQPVEPDRLAYLLCHPAYLRRILFCAMERNGHRPKETRPAPYEPEEGQIATPESLRGSDYSPEELAAHVREICALAGVEIPEFSAA